MSRYSEGRFRAVGLPYVIYDGLDLNDYFEIVDVGTSAQPNIETNTATIPGVPGEHYYSRQLGPREVNLRLMARADFNDRPSVIQTWRSLAPLISKDVPKPLYLDDEMYLLAVLTGSTELEFLDDRGAVDVTFTAYDPYYHGRIHEIELKAGETDFRVSSLAEVWPVIKVKGATGTLRVEHVQSGDAVVVPNPGEAEIEIRTEYGRVERSGAYVPVDLAQTDYFSLPPSSDVTISLSSGSGVLVYEERAL